MEQHPITWDEAYALIGQLGMQVAEDSLMRLLKLKSKAEIPEGLHEEGIVWTIRGALEFVRAYQPEEMALIREKIIEDLSSPWPPGGEK